MKAKSQDNVSLCGDDGGNKEPSNLHKPVRDTSTGVCCQPGEPASTASTPEDISGETHTAEGNDETRQSGVPSKGRPLFIEICAGKAMLSRCFKEAGFDSIAIDHSKNRFQPLAHICNIDLTTSHGWEFLDHLVSHYNVLFVHAAPPCGTCSGAREIQLSGTCPQPLRTEGEPAGLSTLLGEDRDRVVAANAIYSGLSSFLQKCSRLGIPWSVENPARSLLWATPWFQPLLRVASFYTFEACAGPNAKLTNHFSVHCLRCAGYKLSVLATMNTSRMDVNVTQQANLFMRRLMRLHILEN